MTRLTQAAHGALMQVWPVCLFCCVSFMGPTTISKVFSGRLGSFISTAPNATIKSEILSISVPFKPALDNWCFSRDVSITPSWRNLGSMNKSGLSTSAFVSYIVTPEGICDKPKIVGSGTVHPALTRDNWMTFANSHASSSLLSYSTIALAGGSFRSRVDKSISRNRPEARPIRKSSSTCCNAASFCCSFSSRDWVSARAALSSLSEAFAASAESWASPAASFAASAEAWASLAARLANSADFCASFVVSPVFSRMTLLMYAMSLSSRFTFTSNQHSPNIPKRINTQPKAPNITARGGGGESTNSILRIVFQAFAHSCFISGHSNTIPRNTTDDILKSEAQRNRREHIVVNIAEMAMAIICAAIIVGEIRAAVCHNPSRTRLDESISQSESSKRKAP